MEALGAQRKIRLVLRGERVDKSSPAEEPQRAATSLWQAYHTCRATMTELET